MASRLVDQNLPSCYDKDSMRHVTHGASTQILELTELDDNQQRATDPEQLTSRQSMELPTGDQEVRGSLRLSWAIYGGHISGRRHQGVKMNPIYQENNGEFWDSQSNIDNPASDIQIKMYENLPRHHFIRASSSAPNIPYACSTSISRVPYVCNGLMAHLGEMEQKDATLHFSDFSLPGRRDGGSIDNEGRDIQTGSDLRNNVRSADHMHPWSWPQSDRGYRKQLIRQQGIDVTCDDVGNIEKMKSLPSTSNSPSRRPASISILSSQFGQIKRRRMPRILKKTTFLRKTKLSVLREQSTSTENEPSGVFENERSDVSDNERNDVSEHERSDVSDNERNDVSEHERSDVSDNERNDVSEHERSDVSDNERNDVSEHERSDVSDNERNDVNEHEQCKVSDTSHGNHDNENRQ